MQIPAHNKIGLFILAHEKRVRSVFIKAVPFIKTDSLFVFLPDAKPDILLMPVLRFPESLFHQVLAETLSLEFAGNIYPFHFQRCSIPPVCLGGRLVQFQIACELAVRKQEIKFGMRVVQLIGKLPGVESVLKISLQIFSRIPLCKGFRIGLDGKFAKSIAILGGASPEKKPHMFP